MYNMRGFGWVAGGDANTEGVYVFTAGPEVGQNISYLPWVVGQPNNGGGGGVPEQDCMKVLNTASLPNVLDDDACFNPLPFVIEYECAAGLEFNATGCQSKSSTSSFCELPS